MLSICTPTHDTTYLIQAYLSLREQQGDWEWVIQPSRPSVAVPTCITDDPRVRVLPTVDEHRIGKLKWLCGMAARGHIVEFDHDDYLLPRAIEDIAAAFDKGADFVYSDITTFIHPGDKSHHYKAAGGWENYPLEYHGRPLVATRCFPVTPANLCEIYHAPDHVRAWRREFYREIGGHDRSLPVCDDHELMIRSYLAGGRFFHLDRAAYLYRFHAGNTILADRANIQYLTEAFKRKYTERLVREWCRREGTAFTPTDAYAEEFPPSGCFRVDGQMRRGKAWTARLDRMYDALVPGGWVLVDAVNGELAAKDFGDRFKVHLNYVEYGFRRLGAAALKGQRHPDVPL